MFETQRSCPALAKHTPGASEVWRRIGTDATREEAEVGIERLLRCGPDRRRENYRVVDLAERERKIRSRKKS